MKNWKYVIPLLVFALIAVITCSKKEEEAGVSWTIIGYFDGNNNLDISQNNTSFTIEDVHEFEDVGSTDRVKVVVALGSLKTGGIVKYYLVEKHENELPDSISSPVLQNLGTKDMSDPQTLRSFIEFAVSNYPADHYMLIVDDHGGGWRGVCVDEQNGAGDMMTLPELKGAIPDNVHLDIIVFHACLMSMAEVAYELKDKADYMVASEFTLPMQSVLRPGEWYQALTQNPDMSAEELARKIVEAVYHAGENKGKTVHMAAIDLSKMTALGSKVADFGNALVTESGNYWNEVLDAWKLGAIPLHGVEVRMTNLFLVRPGLADPRIYALLDEMYGHRRLLHTDGKTNVRSWRALARVTLRHCRRVNPWWRYGRALLNFFPAMAAGLLARASYRRSPLLARPFRLLLRQRDLEFIASLLLGTTAVMTIGGSPAPAIDIDVEESYRFLAAEDEAGYRQLRQALERLAAETAGPPGD